MPIEKENSSRAAELRTVAEAKVAAQVVATESLNGQDVKLLMLSMPAMENKRLKFILQVRSA